ncbi:serine/threonine protein kinase [Kitasatospora sp. MAA4]|uniref:serine/threonine-protein kinase n=1 Tax=Kitasatospora sp. MAA4 TaxID=3035093 RepID=UPI0024736796|nr:serine/threonine-protein kinase [Kitasatospora sp. MAA4]MDH6135900.1 serine/threonine protein kinase [Kitasatospora sp. MAA4]
MSGQDQVGAESVAESDVSVPAAQPSARPAEPAVESTQRMLAGRYELGERLGRGGMGTVWRAKDRMLDREVAVKELTVSHLPEEDLAILQSRMKQEARAAARIKHPGVITIHDVLEQDGRPWIVMELVDGRSLADVISQDGTLAPRDAAEVGAQVLAALHRGHQLGVLHRDVKPANVLLEHGTGRAVLLDFGIAALEGSGELTRPGDLVGSPDYLAPERAQGERPGPASDIWGLGATLYAAVEGQSPFRRDSPISTLAAVVSEPLPEPKRAGALGPVLAALLAREVADRPSADEALRMLAEVTAGHTIDIKRTPREQPRTPTQQVPVVDRNVVEAAPGPVGPPPPRQSELSSTAPTQARPAAEQPVRRRRSGLRLALVGLLAAVLAGTAAFVANGGLNRTSTLTAGPPPSIPVTTSSPTASEDVTASPVPLDSPPAGYVWQQDEQGFRFLLPTTGGTWGRSMRNNNIYYTPDGQRHLIQFAVTVGAGETPLAHLQSLEGDNIQKYKDYHRVSMAATQVHGHPAAKWVWTFTCPASMCTNAGPRQDFEEEFTDSDGTSYAMLSSGPLGDATVTEARFIALLNNFTVTH